MGLSIMRMESGISGVTPPGDTSTSLPTREGFCMANLSA